MQLSGKLLPILAFFSFLIKTIIISPSISDALIISALIAYIALDEYRLKDNKIKRFEEQLHVLTQQNTKQEEQIRNLTSAISSVKLASGLRPMTGLK